MASQPRVQTVLDALERIAPSRYAYEWDSVGLQVGDRNAPVRKGLVTLDRSLAAVEEAARIGAEVVISHHPLFFRPMNRLDLGSADARTVAALLRNGIALLTAHTNWDCAPGGINDALAAELGLQVCGTFGSDSKAALLKLVAFVPPADAEKVLDACAEAGAGRIGAYERCAYRVEGEGTFRPLEGANPAIGEVGRVERVAETRLEMVLPETSRGAVERALRRAHPYEEPAYDFVAARASAGHPAGRLAEFSGNFGELAARVSERLGSRVEAWGSVKDRTAKIALVGGAADGEWRAAQAAGANVLITGEVKQHVALEAQESGFRMVAAGHYATEMPGMREMARRLAEEVGEVEWSAFEPEPGASGRPLAVG